MPTATYSTESIPQDIYDLTGKTFGRFTVVRLERITKGRRFWVIRCNGCESESVQPSYFRTRIPTCGACEEKALIESGQATPQWLRDLGFDITFWSRFWPKVNKGGPAPSHRPEIGSCWLWTAGTNGSDYGCIGANLANGNRDLIAAHRASWIIHSRALIQDGLNVLHHCDTPRCLRPEHLFLGSTADNSDDMIAKGRARHPKGEFHPNAVLTDELVLELRRMHRAGEATYKEIASIFNCSPSTIAMAVRGDNWRHLR